MFRLLSLLMAYLSAMVYGVDYIPADEKPFTEEGYYQLDTNSYPDDRLLYRNMISSLNPSDQKCDYSPYELKTDSERQIVETAKGSVYFPFTLKVDQTPATVLKSGVKTTFNGEAFVLFEVPKGTEIVAPYNATLDNASTVVKSTYPDADPVRGVALTIETEANTSGEIYKVSYATLNRLWCNMRKEKPDDNYNEDAEKPLYYLDESFTGKTTFNQKDILGEAGKSGMPFTRYAGEAYIAIKVQKYVSGMFVDSTIEDLCGIED